MKRLAIYSHVAKSTVWELIIYDRLQTLRHSTTRNRLAAEIVFVCFLRHAVDVVWLQGKHRELQPDLRSDCFLPNERKRREYLFWSRNIHYAKKEARCQHTLKTHADEVSPPPLHVPFPRALLFYLRSHCQISVLRIHYHF